VGLWALKASELLWPDPKLKRPQGGGQGGAGATKARAAAEKDATHPAEDGGDGEDAYDWGNEFSGGGDGDGDGGGNIQKERTEAGYYNSSMKRLAFHVTTLHARVCFPPDASSSAK
jgi:hypothetical protein